MLTPARQHQKLQSSSYLLALPRVKTKARTRAFLVAVPTLWNTLPDNIKSAGNVITLGMFIQNTVYSAVYVCIWLYIVVGICI